MYKEALHLEGMMYVQCKIVHIYYRIDEFRMAFASFGPSAGVDSVYRGKI